MLRGRTSVLILFAAVLVTAVIVAVSTVVYMTRRHPDPATVSGVVNAPSLDRFTQFAGAFATKLESASAKLGDANDSSPLKYEVHCVVVGTDLKKSDSVAHPIVGEAKIKEYETAQAKAGGFMSVTISIYTINFSPNADGTWSMVNGKSRVESEHVAPESMRRSSHVGEERELSADWGNNVINQKP